MTDRLGDTPPAPKFPGVQGYRLTTAEITYHLPDYPELLQNYVWQGLDRLPEFPMLRQFLAFWDRNLEGRLHSVRVASTEVIKPGQYRHLDGLLQIH